MFCSQCFGGSERSSSSQNSPKRIVSLSQLPAHFTSAHADKEGKHLGESRISLRKKSRTHKNNYKQLITQETEGNIFLTTETSLPLKPSTSQPILIHQNYPNLYFQSSVHAVEQCQQRKMIKPPSFIRKINVESPIRNAGQESPCPQVRINFISNNSIKQSKETYTSKFMRSTLPSFHYNHLDSPHLHARTDTQMNNPSLVSSTSIQGNNYEFSIEEGKQLSKSQGYNKSQHNNFLSPHAHLKEEQYSSKSMIIHNLDEIALTQTVSNGSSKHSQFSEVIGGSADLMRDYKFDGEEMELFENPNLLFQRRRSNLLEYRKDSLSEH